MGFTEDQTVISESEWEVERKKRRYNVLVLLSVTPRRASIRFWETERDLKQSNSIKQLETKLL